MDLLPLNEGRIARFKDEDATFWINSTGDRQRL